MADFSRSYLYPDNRARVRAQITCPRCRVDPSHISRQYWEATRPQQPTIPSVENAPSTSNSGYPDLCPRTTSSAGSQRLQQTPLAANTGHSQYPRAGYYSSTSASVTPSSISRHADGHTSRSGGETWRIRGVFENHLTPDVTRRTDSNPGPLPDVTRHSSALPPPAIHHSRVASAPVTSGFETPRNAASCNRYPTFDPRHRPLASSFRESVPRSEPTSRSAPAPAPWKREQSSLSGSPWVTRGQQTESRPAHYNSGNTATTSNSTNNQIQPSTTTSSSSCWRPVPPHVLSQCPLPDLVTPRRQARKQCCGLLATHSVVVRWLLVVVASLGLLCAIVGTVLGGVVRASGKEHLSIALLLVGLGIVLVSMSGIAWRLTTREGAPSCRTMFGLRRARSEPHRRFVPRVPHYGRPHPFSAMLYPDIPLRPPPPSYQASMQEYRLRLLLMDRPQMPSPPPPPTYRAPATVYPRFPMPVGPSDYSRPPSYRSRPPSSAGQPSPLGSEDVDLNATEHSSNLPADDAAARPPSCNPASCSQPRPAPSSGNHVEVVAQV